MPTMADDQRVMDRHAHDPAGLSELARNANIFPARFEVAGWMVVGDDDRGRVGEDRAFKDLSSTDNARSECPRVGDVDTDERVVGGEEQNEEDLPVCPFQEPAGYSGSIVGSADSGHLDIALADELDSVEWEGPVRTRAC
jgi:hypothetical protein